MQEFFKSLRFNLLYVIEASQMEKRQLVFVEVLAEKLPYVRGIVQDARFQGLSLHFSQFIGGGSDGEL